MKRHPRSLLAGCSTTRRALAAMILGLIPLSAFAGALWDRPTGPEAAEEISPGPFDREAGERRRLRDPVPTTTAPRVSMWYTPKSPGHIERHGRIIDPDPASPLAAYRAKRISLSISDLHPQAAIEEFGKAAGLALRGQSGYLFRDASLPHVNLQLRDAPLLEGLLEFCSQTGTVPIDIVPRRISVGPGDPETAVGTWCISGPFAIVLQRIENVADLTDGKSNSFNTPNSRLPAGRQGARMSLLVAAEPGISIAQFPTTLNIDNFVDNADQVIEVGTEVRPPSFSSQAPSTTVRQLHFPLTMPERPGHEILRLKGSMTFLVSRKTEQIAEELPTAGVTREVNGMRVEIQPLTRNGTNNYRATVRVSQGDLDDDLWARTRRALDDAHFVVEDAGGQPLNVSANSNQPRTETSVTLVGNVFTRDENAIPARILLDLPTSLQEVKVPFEFNNLVLP
jgi:hypothetical protein